jgi:hypothetical protein
MAARRWLQLLGETFKRTYMYKSIFLTTFFLITWFIFSSKKSEEYSLIEKTFKTDSLYMKGQDIFKRDCASCHYIGMNKKMTAPPLGGITKLRKKDWLYSYTRNPYKMLEQGDKIAKQLRSQGWALMSSFPNLKNSDLDAIYYFVEKRYEMSKRNIPIEK